MMMVGTTAVFSMVHEIAVLNIACVSDFTTPNSHGKFTFLPCNSSIKLSSYKSNILATGILKEKLGFRTVVFGLPHDDTGKENSRKLDDDPVLICPGDDDSSEEPENGDPLPVFPDNKGNFKKQQKDYFAKSVSHLQPMVEMKDCLFDQMKAIKLHVLAMEQWNSSRIKMCHRLLFPSIVHLQWLVWVLGHGG